VLRRYQERYEGFGPTLACEKLEEEGYRLDHETLRLWLLKEGLWSKRRKRKKHRSWRERKEHFGEMVQMDGSHHDWFEGRGQRAVLMNMVDDATGSAYARFHEGEKTRAAMLTLWGYINTHGIPLSLYVDKDSIYVTEREATVDEELRGEEPLTQFGRAVKKLGIKIIVAHSPQAKGRVERKNGVFQDRLVKELRLEGIYTIGEANTLLEGRFLDELNERFSIAPRSDVDFHRPVPKGVDLRRVFCFEKERLVDNDWTVRWKNRNFQIKRGSRVLPPARRKVSVQEWLDGSIHIVYRGEEVRCKEIARQPPKQKIRVKTRAKSAGEGKSHKPPVDHPWKKGLWPQRMVASP
jgi:hypothetical protein